MPITSLAAVISLVHDIYPQLSNLPTQLRALDGDVESLHSIVQSIEDSQLYKTFDGQRQTRVDAALGRSLQTLQDLQGILNGPSEDGDLGPVVEPIRQQLQSQVHELESLGGEPSSSTEGRSNSDIESKEAHDDVLNRLTHIDHLAQHKAIFQKHCRGTGKPFLQSNRFQTWLNNEHQTLFCHGIPGAGKSVLASIVVDHLQQLFGQNDNIGVAYIYCDIQRQHERSARSILGSLLKQLTQYQPVLPGTIELLIRSQKGFGGRVSFRDISRALSTTCGLFSRLFIVIDALDEVQLLDGSHGRVISEILLLQSRHRLNFLVTSRSIPDVMRLFKDAPSMEIRADKSDVEKYVSSNLKLFQSFVLENEQLQKQVINGIADAVDGMFYLAGHHLSSLISRKSPRAFRTALESLTSEHTACDSLCSTTLQRIEDEALDRKAFAKEVLSIVICTRRQLSIREIQHALAVEIDNPYLDTGNLPDVDDMISACLGLLTISPQSGTIQFAHSSAQQCFTWIWDTLHPRAHETIAAICITYLSLKAFSAGPCASDGEYEQRLEEYPFYEYAAQFWGFHVQKKRKYWLSRGRKDPEQQLGLDMLTDSVKVAVCTQGLFARKGVVNYSQKAPKVEGLHLAAYFGLGYLYTLLTDRGQQPQTKDSNGHTPLWWALEQRQHVMVDLLKDKDPITLRLLIKDQKRDLITYLVNSEYNINTLDFWKRTPLHSVISSGNHLLLADFINYGADVNARDREGVTPLRLAVQLGRLDLVDLLLRHGVSPEDISIGEWRRLYKMRSSDVLMASSHGDKGMIIESCSAMQKEQLLRWADRASRKRHLILWGNSKMWNEVTNISRHDLAPFVLTTNGARDDEQRAFQYAVSVHLPYRYDHLRAGPNRETIGIAWTVRWQADGDDPECSQCTDFSSTLPSVWVPDSGVSLLLRFLSYLKRKWLDLCDFEQDWLNECRRQVFLVKGENREILDGLLRDAEWWTQLRSVVQRQVRDAKSFATKYCSFHDGEYAATQLEEAAETLLREVSQQIDLLDSTSKDLIQIEFNLVSINEARLSTSTALSMKRLSWISFIFLPATFASTLFGMNINILQDNPDWRWCLPFVGGSLMLSIVGWLVFKYNPVIEAWLDRKTELIFSRTRVGAKVTKTYHH